MTVTVVHSSDKSLDIFMKRSLFSDVEVTAARDPARFSYSSISQCDHPYLLFLQMFNEMDTDQLSNSTKDTRVSWTEF